MRRVVVDALALAAVLTVVCLGYGQPRPEDKDKKPAKSKLEEMLEQALANNPDIRVAEARVREAEAKLSKTRLEVTQKVATLYAAIESARQGLANAEADLERLNALRAKGVVGQEDLGRVRLQVATAKAELAKLQAEAAYLLGKAPGEKEKTTSTDKQVEAGLRWLAAIQLAQGQDEAARVAALLALAQARVERAAGPMSERIRKALDKPVTLNYRKKREKREEILRDLFDKADIPVHFRTGALGRTDLSGTKPPAEVELMAKEPLPLGAALQLYQDLADDGVRFVVRDYGILVTDSQWVPPGAVLLHDFWKHKPVDPKKRDDSAKNPPPEHVEGLVKEVDKNGLIKINLGSDAGLQKGHTLEVFRLGVKESKYLGIVRIVEVSAREAVGQPVGKMTGPVEPGDRVASRILNQ